MSADKQRELTGKVHLVTGSNTGIGRATAEALAARGAHVVLANRSEERTAPVLEAIRYAGGSAEFLQLELDDLASVRATADRFLASGSKLHVLVNNAGLAGKHGLTKDGFELTFGTNYLGPYLLTRLLLPLLRRHAPARIVNVSSASHYQAKRGIDWEAVRRKTASTTGLPEYEVSKLAQVLFTRKLAAGEAGPGVHSYALHPGTIASDVWREVPAPARFLIKLFMRSAEEGARTSIYCASSPEVADHDGHYYDDRCKERRPSRLALDDALANELWERSDRWVGPFLERRTSQPAPLE